MAYYDLPLHELKKYKPKIKEPGDFDSFWKETLLTSEKQGASVMKLIPYTFGLELVDAFDAEFPGFMGQPVKGWFIVPKKKEGPLPCVVEYIGYGGGRGFPYEWLGFANAGYAYFVMDTRGQGTTWRNGDTPDHGDYHTGPEFPGFMTRGIQHRDNYYYRRLICDAVRAVDAVRALDIVDAKKIALTGISQGGALSLSVAGLRSDIAVIMPDVPFLCYFERSVTTTDEDPYSEIVAYLKRHRLQKEAVFAVLNYFDGVHFAKRARARALFSAGLMDTTCPPSGIFAAYNWYKGKKEISVYEFNNHESGEVYQFIRKLEFIKKYL